MTVLYEPTPAHECAPPYRQSGYSVGWPALPVGGMWRCNDCGTVWIVDRPPLVHSGQQRIANEWRLANWRERRRAKRMQADQ